MVMNLTHEDTGKGSSAAVSCGVGLRSHTAVAVG